MTVSELIKFLQEQPQDIQVVYRCYSEQVLLESEDVSVVELCKQRPDGLVQNPRPDMPTKSYLMLHG